MLVKFCEYLLITNLFFVYSCSSLYEVFEHWKCYCSVILFHMFGGSPRHMLACLLFLQHTPSIGVVCFSLESTMNTECFVVCLYVILLLLLL